MRLDVLYANEIGLSESVRRAYEAHQVDDQTNGEKGTRHFQCAFLFVCIENVFEESTNKIRKVTGAALIPFKVVSDKRLLMKSLRDKNLPIFLPLRP